MKNLNRTKIIQIRTTKKEKQSIETNAAKLGISVSELLRDSSLGLDCEKRASEKKLMVWRGKLSNLALSLEVEDNVKDKLLEEISKICQS